MKHFSISYTVTKEDYDCFNKEVNKAMLHKRLKFTAVMLAISLLFFLLGLYSMGVTVFFGIFINFFVGDIVNRTYMMKTTLKSKIGKRPVTIDFYNDHFEILHFPDEYYKGKSEKHYPLWAVKMVIENKDYFYFKLEDYSTLIIPKRDVENENILKIKNMIDNLYPDRFLED